MKGRYEVLLSGSGGQGLVSSGIMLGEAAILEGKNVVQTTSYGIAQRGGLSMAEVIMDEDEIVFQQVEKPDLVLALNEEAMERSLDCFPEALTVYDTTLIRTRAGSHIYGFPFTAMAKDLGLAAAANLIAIGAMIALTGLVRPDSMEAVVNERFSGEKAEINLKALHMGIGLLEPREGVAEGVAKADGRFDDHKA